jgi:branched-chain amino acid aminotransferase
MAIEADLVFDPTLACWKLCSGVAITLLLSGNAPRQGLLLSRTMISSTLAALRGSFRLRLAWTFNHRPSTALLLYQIPAFFPKLSAAIFCPASATPAFQPCTEYDTISRNTVYTGGIDMKHREIERDFFLFNGNLLPVSEFDPEHATHYPSVYEVIRVVEGVPLFWEEHLKRMQRSLTLLGSTSEFNQEDLHRKMLQLIRENNVANHNMKIVMNHLENGGMQHQYLFFITSHYPTDRQLMDGVPVITHQAVRQTPHAKVIALDFRSPILEALGQSGAYEALLVNEAGEVTEGSRSNFFVVHNGQFYTPPSDKVLEGITRQVVIKLLHRLGLPLTYQPITLSFLQAAEGLFLTGTSPGILPVNRVDEQTYRSSELKPLNDLQKLYAHFVKTYISIHQQEESL